MIIYNIASLFYLKQIMKHYFPNFSIDNMSQDTLMIHFSNVHFSFLNSIRRIVKSEVPVLAINSIRFKEYSGYLEEDTLAHRLSLIPIICKDIDKLSYEKDCSKCDIGCSFCNVKFTLEKIGADDNRSTNVYSSDLKLVDPLNPYRTETLYFPKNHHGILLCRLNPGEHIKLECTAVKSNASQHAKFSASTVCFFKKLDNDDDSYLFTLETNGNIDAINVFRQSLEIFIQQNLSLKKHINKFMTRDECNIEVPFQDTILNPLQREILNTYQTEIDLFIYKKHHILSERKHSHLEVFYDDTIVTPLHVKDYIKTSINRLVTFSEILLSTLNENFYKYEIIKNKKDSQPITI